MINVGIIGSAGYAAGELIRCLLLHPEVKIDFCYSNSQKGKNINEIHQDLIGLKELNFSGDINENVDIVFLCLGHGNSYAFLEKNTFSKNTKIIDLSNDFRLKNKSIHHKKDFVYGLVELNKAAIQQASYIANPGCFATAIQLALLPLAANKQIKAPVHINAITGSTGAGQSFSSTSHFSWRNNNISIYKAFQHQHLAEINESLVQLQAEFNSELNFIPVRGDFTRGIFCSAYLTTDLTEAELIDIYQSYYEDATFTFITNNNINLKQVVNTNNCLLQIQKIDNKVLVTSVIDNLLKGAAGQAIQNMNLMFDLPETTGLQFKASYF